MTIRGLRLLTVIGALLVLVLPAAAVASSSAKPADRGVVQSVTPKEIVLKALDGKVLSFTIAPATRVRVNGTKAPLGAIAPGFVATVVHDKKGRAALIEAFGTPVTSIDRGVVTAVAPNAITFRLPGGDLVTVPLDRTTRFRFQGAGAPGARGLARPGAVVAVTHAAGDAPALVVNVLKRAGA